MFRPEQIEDGLSEAIREVTFTIGDVDFHLDGIAVSDDGRKPELLIPAHVFDRVASRDATSIEATVQNVNDNLFLNRVRRQNAMSTDEWPRYKRILIENGVMPTDDACVPEYARIIKDLILEHGIQRRPSIHYTHWAARPEQRAVHLWPIRSVQGFVFALHEIGHVVAPSAQQTAETMNGRRVSVANEMAAWRFARRTVIARTAAGQWLPAMQQELSEGLSTYLHVATREQRRQMETMIRGAKLNRQ